MAGSGDYLQRAAERHPLLTPLQELELGRQIRLWQDWPTGPDNAPVQYQRLGRQALDRFVVSNIRLARHIAMRYRDRGVPTDDLVQAAIEGMMVAYKRFKPELGYRSSSYACWYAKQGCQLAIAAMGQHIKLPLSVSDGLGALTRAREAFQQQHGRTPNEQELAAQAGITTARLQQLNLIAMRSRALSLDGIAFIGKGSTIPQGQGDTPRPQGLGDGSSWFDLPSEELSSDQLQQTEMSAMLQAAIDETTDLDPQQRFIIRQRYLSPDTPPSLARLAHLLNMSKSEIQRLEQASLVSLRATLETEHGNADMLLTA